MSELITPLLVLNGTYDLLCASSILWIPKCELSQLHPNMFISTSPMIQRLLAYWIFTYGLVRLAAGWNPSFQKLAAATYFLEAFVLEYECQVGKTMHPDKVRMVSLFSMMLGCLVLRN